MNDHSNKTPVELVLWGIGIGLGAILLYVVGVYIALGIFEGRDNDPPVPDQEYYGDREKERERNRLLSRKTQRDAKAAAWLPLLLWYLGIRWVWAALLWCSLRVGDAFIGLRKLGRWIGAPRKVEPEPEPHLGPEAKDPLPKATVVRR